MDCERDKDIDSGGLSRAPRPSYATVPLEVSEGAPAFMLEYLDRRFPDVGLETWRSRMERGLVTDAATGQVYSPDAPLESGTRIAYFREVAEEPEITTLESIIYEDEEIVVVDKPHGLTVAPVGGQVRQSLLYRMEERLSCTELAPIHRLDRATAGLVLFSKRRRNRSSYHSLFARGSAKKRYLGVSTLDTVPRQRYWRVTSRIEADQIWYRRRSVASPDSNAVSDIFLSAVARSETTPVGLFLILPETGKQHQIRLHQLQIGYPLLGDRLYPDLLDEDSQPDLPLQLLASELSFRDPLSGERRLFRSRLSLVSWTTLGREPAGARFPDLGRS